MIVAIILYVICSKKKIVEYLHCIAPTPSLFSFFTCYFGYNSTVLSHRPDFCNSTGLSHRPDFCNSTVLSHRPDF